MYCFPSLALDMVEEVRGMVSPTVTRLLTDGVKPAPFEWGDFLAELPQGRMALSSGRGEGLRTGDGKGAEPW